MTWEAVFRPEAENDALAMRRWYDGRREGLGDEFAAEVDRIVIQLVDNPFTYQRARGEIRRATLRRCPYAIRFRTTVNRVIGLAVHGRQNPVRWQRRS